MRKLLLAAVVVLVAAFIYLWWVSPSKGPDLLPMWTEAGIRVKGGSLLLIPQSGKGFEASGNSYRTRGETKGCYRVVVMRANCVGGIVSVDLAERLMIEGGDKREHVLQDRGAGAGMRLSLPNGNGWSEETVDDDGTRRSALVYGKGSPVVKFSVLQAFARNNHPPAGKPVLSCTPAKDPQDPAKDQEMEALLTPVECQ